VKSQANFVKIKSKQILTSNFQM